MNLRRIYAIVLRQFYLISETPVRFIQLIWGALDIVLWGFISRYLATMAEPGMELIPVLLGAILLLDFLMRVMYGITSAFLEDVWTRNFLNVFASPLTLGEYVVGLISSSVITTTISFFVIIAVAAVFFGFSIFAFGLSLLPFLLILFFFGVTLGIFSVGLVLRYGPSAEWFTWPLPSLIAPFVGVFYPLATLPVWMQWVGYALPPTYVFEGMRSLVYTSALPVSGMSIGLVLSLAYVFLVYVLFKRTYRTVIKLGLIARYSAESSG